MRDWSAFLYDHDQITQEAEIRGLWNRCPVTERSKALAEDDCIQLVQRDFYHLYIFKFWMNTESVIVL